jgi:Tfp pilus assembly major pilin PilA
MRANIHAILGLTTLLAAAACNNAKSPDKVADNVAAANQSASKEVADAQREQQKDLSSDAYDVAVARAEGDHKVAIKKCDALDGHDQKACKDQADADYDAAKANAKASKVAGQP